MDRHAFDGCFGALWAAIIAAFVLGALIVLGVQGCARKFGHPTIGWSNPGGAR